ncbi:MAG: hypothetical protein V1880_02820 [Patescibacteria group bacterium]|nr:hypothetical protein [Patescibacteria group bacterium]MBU1684697.1 hypothetical protein [Patescibacteria group bacterium]MBU1938357.1 hypothetical protein [Patescibacteria group bacterium]
MANTKIGFPQGPEQGGESAKAGLAALIKRYENDPEALERILTAGQEAAEQVEETRIDESPDFMQQNAAAVSSFMQRSGIYDLLASTPPEQLKRDYIGLTPFPVNEEAPVEISQEDFDALFGSAIYKRKPQGRVYGSMIEATVLIRIPDGKVYQLSMMKGENGKYLPFEYFETDIKSLRMAKEYMEKRRKVPEDTREQILGLS